MDTITDIIFLAILLTLNALVCSWLAYLSTVPWGPLFPFKPFNCDACLTFWYTFISSLLWSRFFVDPAECSNFYAHFGAFVLASLVFALSNFFYIKSKIKIHE